MEYAGGHRRAENGFKQSRVYTDNHDECYNEIYHHGKLDCDRFCCVGDKKSSMGKWSQNRKAFFYTYYTV